MAFGFRAQQKKVSRSPLTTCNDVIQMSLDVKHHAQHQQTHHHENKKSHVKLHMHKGNMEIPFQTGMHYTSTHVMYIAFGLWQCTTVWPTKEIHKQIPQNTKHALSWYYNIQSTQVQLKD